MSDEDASEEDEEDEGDEEASGEEDAEEEEEKPAADGEPALRATASVWLTSLKRPTKIQEAQDRTAQGNRRERQRCPSHCSARG